LAVKGNRVPAALVNHARRCVRAIDLAAIRAMDDDAATFRFGAGQPMSEIELRSC
jgi:hypothetical protein